MTVVADAAPVVAPDFAATMAPLGPFERRPALAVAVSGGVDSLALTLLAATWVAERGGTLLALTVDHGLRPGSAMEAAQVGHWLAARGIAHEILPWRGDKPASGIQEAARAARYRLLEERCARAGVLHLLVAHTADDLAETVALRAARGSGPAGLAGMAAVRELDHIRILRPLLSVTKARLRATCVAAGQDWIEDPSNRDPRFARARLRTAGGPVPGPEAARAAGLDRARTDADLASLLAECAAVFPEGYAELDPAPLRAAPHGLRAAALQRVLLAVGGGAYPPRRERLERLLGDVDAGTLGGGRTLAGCRVAMRRGRLVIWREAAAQPGPIEVAPGAVWRWDGRHVVYNGSDAPVRCGALGAEGVTRWRAARPDALPPAPPFVLPTLPALCAGEMAPNVPQLAVTLRRDDLSHAESKFAPTHKVAGAPFGVV